MTVCSLAHISCVTALTDSHCRQRVMRGQGCTLFSLVIVLSISLSGGQWLLHKIDLNKHPNGKCLDGTPGGYWLFPGSGSGKDKFIVHHQVLPLLIVITFLDLTSLPVLNLMYVNYACMWWSCHIHSFIHSMNQSSIPILLLGRWLV